MVLSYDAPFKKKISMAYVRYMYLSCAKNIFSSIPPPPPPPIMERSSIQLPGVKCHILSKRDDQEFNDHSAFFSYIKTRLSLMQTLLLLPKADDRIYVGVRTMVRVVQLTLRGIRPGPIMLSKDHPFPPGSKREGVLLSLYIP